VIQHARTAGEIAHYDHGDQGAGRLHSKPAGLADRVSSRSLPSSSRHVREA
jgi:hypothetical protein